MGYNGGKRVWPQRNSGFSKSSIRYGNKIFRMATLPILKIGFSAVGLSNNGRRKTYRSNSISIPKVQRQYSDYRSTNNTSSYSTLNFNSFFNTSNIARFSNVRFESVIVKYKELIAQNVRILHDVDKLSTENRLLRSRIKTKYWLRLFYKNEINKMEFDILANENTIKAQKERIVNEYLDLSNFSQSEKSLDLIDLIQSSNLFSSSWILYPKKDIQFKLDINYLNYSLFFQRSSIKVLGSSIPIIDNLTDIYVCLKDSHISIVFLPCAVMIYTSESNFAIFDYSDLQCTNKEVIIKEEDSFLNPQATVDSMTWKHQKMDGNPDLRYKNNPQVPIVRYSNITLQTNNGIRIELLFLNLDFGRLFYETITKMSIKS